MWGLVESGSITKIINKPKSLVIGDVRHSRKIFELWSKSELAAIGIYEITFDNSKKKDERWYINTNQTYTYDASAGTITAAYGDATEKPHADTNWTQDEIDNDEAPAGADTDTLKARGLKYILIQSVKKDAESLLNQTDWYVTRKSEKSTAIPSNITTWRNAIRTKQAAMETSITNASNTAALETLYTYVNTADEGDPKVMERPIGEFPELGS